MCAGILCVLLAPCFATADPPATQPITPVRFLTRDQGRAAIVDETNDPYFKLLQPMEMSAKTAGIIVGNTIVAGQDECRRRYQQAVLDFTPGEMRAVDALATTISRATEKDFPLFARTPWSFIKVGSGVEGGNAVTRGPPIILEGGNAFTRGPHIVLPAGAINSLLREQEKAPPDKKFMLLVRSGRLLANEQFHVVRRTRPDAFAKMYEELWGLKHADRMDLDPWITQHQLLDPDAIDQYWVYQMKDGQGARWIWPIQVLGNALAPPFARMADAHPMAVHLDGSPEQGFRPEKSPAGAPVMEPLYDLPQYVSQFYSQNAVNPAKAAADLFSRIVVFHIMLADNPPPGSREAIDRGKKELEPVRAWFEKILR